MRISAKVEYACLAVAALARPRLDGSPTRIREIAETHGIPERYLVQILLRLKEAGLVRSTRGSSGGYRLARPADAISLGEVMAAIDGADSPAREPRRPAGRILDSVWEDIRRAEQSVLDRTSVAQIADGATPPEWVI